MFFSQARRRSKAVESLVRFSPSLDGTKSIRHQSDSRFRFGIVEQSIQVRKEGGTINVQSSCSNFFVIRSLNLVDVALIRESESAYELSAFHATIVRHIETAKEVLLRK